MTKPKLRFDHKEIAVLFSLFVFTSLLMFTVGILVGKGLSEAKYEAALTQTHSPSASEHAHSELPQTKHSPHEASPPSAEAEEHAHEESKPLELVPKEASPTFAKSLADQDAAAPAAILDNPKIQALVENEATPEAHKEQDKGRYPASFSKGEFTVIVGTFPSEQEAKERVTKLINTGFPHAYITPKSMGQGEGQSFYSVGLGYFPDFQAAQKSGQLLQEALEVKSYLVRKTESKQ